MVFESDGFAVQHNVVVGRQARLGREGRAEECFSWRALDSGTQHWCTDQGRGVWACVCICKILCVSKVWNAATQTNPQELIVITRYVWKVTFTSLVLPCTVVKLKILKTKLYVYFPAVRFSDNLSVLRLKLHQYSQVCYLCLWRNLAVIVYKPYSIITSIVSKLIINQQDFFLRKATFSLSGSLLDRINSQKTEISLILFLLFHWHKRTNIK